MTFPLRPPASVLVIVGLVLGAPCVTEAAQPEPPAEDAPPEDGGGFQLEDETADEDLSDVETVETVAPTEDAPPAETPPAETPPPETPPGDEGNWSFEVTDLTEDEAALAKELEVEKVEVEGAKGTVAGTLKDSVTGEPLVGAQVEAIGTKYRTKTGLDGGYTLDLPPGTYEIRFRYDTSQPLRVSQVVVATDQTQTISRDLVPLTGAGETVKVEAEMNRESEGARLLQRKDSAAARDLMSRDEISKSGGGSTGSVARRIVGSTVVGGRFLFVRGLGHRYGNTLFDGARVPSPEPELRTVPLDIFPSGALSAINIQKTFTPDVPGDFVGGSTQLESREVPDELVVELSADIGANTATTGRSMVTNGAFPLPDAFGFGNLPRALPDAISRDAAVQRNLLDENFQPLYTSDDIERFGEAMYTDTRVRRGSHAPPNFGLKATAGWGKGLGNDGSRIGFLAAASFRNKHQTLRESLRLYGVSNDTLQTDAPQVSYESFKTTYNSAWSTIGLVKGRITRNHRLSLLGLYSRDADDETRELRGTAIPVAGQARLINTRLRYVMRSILVTRLGGEHTFPKAKKLQVDWFGSYAQARRDDPAIRDMLFQDSSTPPSGVYRLDATNGGGKQLFLDLVDDTESGAANVTLPFKQWKQLDSKFKIGVWIEGKQRTFATRRFAFQPISGLSPEDIPTGTDNIITDSRIGGGTPNEVGQPFFLNETTRPLDSYTAGQEVYATYAMLELPLVRWFTLAGGARFEASRMRVDPFDPFAQPGDMPNPMLEEGKTRLDDNDLLPSASLIFKPTAKMNVRLSGSRTLARPEFRELARFEFQDFVGGIAVIGNPSLVTTRVWNADLRWEWFPTAAEVVSMSVFYKWFDEPIERVAQPRANGFASFRNADAAQNIGLELEARKNLEFIGRALQHFSVGANFAYIYSRVRLSGRCDPENDASCDPMSPEARDVSTSRERPLQGQSPFVVNTYLDYDNDKSGTSARLLYNAFGRRIDQVMGLGAPDIYEEAQHQFDFVFGQKVYKELALSVAVENIANWPIRLTQGPERAITYLAWPGATVTLGLSWKY